MASPKMSRETVTRIMESGVTLESVMKLNHLKYDNVLGVSIGGKVTRLHQVIAVLKYGERCIGMCATFRVHPSQGGDYDLDNIIIDDNLNCTRNRVVTKPKIRTKVKATSGDTEMIFASQAESARYFNVHIKSIFKAVNGLMKVKGWTLERMVG